MARPKSDLPVDEGEYPDDPFLTGELFDPMDDAPPIRLEDLLAGAYEDPIEDVTFETCPIGTGLPGERFDLKCPECGGDLRLRRSKHGVFYGCINWTTGCKGSHGAHPDGRPLGSPADAATKKARIQAHRVFDRLWQEHGGTPPRMTRAQAYVWMRRVMKMSDSDAHIGRFTAEQCNRLIELVKKRYPGVQTVWDRLGDLGDEDE